MGERYTTAQYTVEERFDVWCVRDEGGRIICDAGTHEDSEDFARRIAAALNHAAAVPELVEALKPFAEFGQHWDARPLRGVGDEFYNIHTGTEHAASLRISDCRRAAAVVEKWEAGK